MKGLILSEALRGSDRFGAGVMENPVPVTISVISEAENEPNDCGE